MNPLALIEKYYPPGTDSHRILLRHSIQVAEKALVVARRVSNRQPVDATFVEEAALLHDIGIFRTSAPRIGCLGDHPYIRHGVLGREILEREGLPRHALVCERHIGVGLTPEDIRNQALPLPMREMVSETIEEKIVAYADLFFSKTPPAGGRERTVAEVRGSLSRFGEYKVAIFDAWHKRFSG
jgi:uncharacterized protein